MFFSYAMEGATLIHFLARQFLSVVGRGSWVVGRGSWVVGRGSWVLGRGSWVVGRGSWVVGRGSWVVGRGSWVVGRGSWVVGRGSWVVGRGSWVVGRGSWVVGRGSWVVGRGSWAVGRGSWVYLIIIPIFFPTIRNHCSLHYYLSPQVGLGMRRTLRSKVFGSELLPCCSLFSRHIPCIIFSCKVPNISRTQFLQS